MKEEWMIIVKNSFISNTDYEDEIQSLSGPKLFL